MPCVPGDFIQVRTWFLRRPYQVPWRDESRVHLIPHTIGIGFGCVAAPTVDQSPGSPGTVASTFLRQRWRTAIREDWTRSAAELVGVVLWLVTSRGPSKVDELGPCRTSAGRYANHRVLCGNVPPTSGGRTGSGFISMVEPLRAVLLLARIRKLFKTGLMSPPGRARDRCGSCIRSIRTRTDGRPTFAAK